MPSHKARAREIPQPRRGAAVEITGTAKLFGSAWASALAAVDRRYYHNAFIVADLSYDPTYAEVLLETFGPRVIGMQISRHGDGMNVEMRPARHGYLPVYTIGRTYLLELFHSQLQSDLLRFADGPAIRRAYEQLVNLDAEFREGGAVYNCPAGAHDDLGIPLAMLAWAAQHPHLEAWLRHLEAARRPRRPRKTYGWEAFT
jgi:hypothetical protein